MTFAYECRRGSGFVISSTAICYWEVNQGWTAPRTEATIRTPCLGDVSKPSCSLDSVVWMAYLVVSAPLTGKVIIMMCIFFTFAKKNNNYGRHIATRGSRDLMEAVRVQKCDVILTLYRQILRITVTHRRYLKHPSFFCSTYHSEGNNAYVLS